ncbi:mannose-6-phosphate isomerase, class I [Streptomyces californicus]|uniref:mannose-6-phosphate isomerase, class I n=1 Tax=Streptomyces californicus TaxID=67351 RepID=UPI00296EA17F|nr:mannose-6-phosphate isomerase, class I [Streptomyces californicus]MDW4918519.1 mannose-6-phosphate isomerase, class I [Streptomyces californicus]
MTAPSLLSPVLRNYPWGSRTAIPALLGQHPDGRPQAELWFGAHSAAPSLLPERPGRPDLAAAITAAPARELGEESLSAHGPELPFLLKLLAAERALSVQVHPTRKQAQDGHDREEAAGVPLDAPHRTFKDRNHKPELLCALEPFDALCGFREPARTAELLDILAVPELCRWSAILRSRPAHEALSSTLRAALSAPDRLTRTVSAALPRLTTPPSPWGSTAAAYTAIAEDFPGDPGLLAALLLNHVRLDAGEALYLAAGVPHAYLRGTGVEVMANSDNVLRCGLTDKHVDTVLLADIVDCTPMRPAILTPTPTELTGETRFCSPAEEFVLSRLEAGTEAVTVTDQGPQVLLCLGAHARLTPGPLLARGEAAFVPAGSPCEVTGVSAVIYRARVPLSAAS